MKYSDFKIKKVTIDDKPYPKSLRDIKDPPKQIYYRGNLNKSIFEKSLAIVGSRRITRYGKEVISKFVGDLVTEQVTTISGFMYGVDTEVHRKTVEFGGKTVAVFGCGLDVCYPPENEKLYVQILENGGVVISEYEPKAKPHLWKFPQRNRIVSGLSSLGVLVIEAAENSGSLITARIAKQQGKRVYAIPGPITSSVSIGTNKLISSGDAKIILNIGNILQKRVKKQEKKLPDFENSLERKIYELLSTEPMGIDEITMSIGVDSVSISTTISVMCLKNFLTDSGGKYYVV